MKKILGITVLFMTLFMCMCCDPDPIEPTYPDAIETEADLDGLWEFVSFTPDGGHTITCGNPDPWKLTIEFDGSAQTCIVTDLCGGGGYSGEYVFQQGPTSVSIVMGTYRGMILHNYDAPFLELRLRISGDGIGNDWYGTLKLEKVD